MKVPCCPDPHYHLFFGDFAFFFFLAVIFLSNDYHYSWTEDEPQYSFSGKEGT